MRNIQFIKPDLNLFFAEMPPVGLWLKHDYNKCNSREDLTKLFHKWIEIGENTRNATTEWCYTSAAYYLYSFLTNKSYESTLNIE